MSNNILPDLTQYQNQWVALAEPDNQVVGSGGDAVEASKAAEANGYQDYTLFKVFSFNKLYIGSHAV
jgi:Family of unknown function (DUF5678)